LEQDAARQTFIDIADSGHDPEQVDKVLALTDNMPLAIDLLAHLVDAEGCSNVLSRWKKEKTSLISQGYNRRSNLDLSIALSLSSPRLSSHPHSKDLLSLLSMLPDGLSDAELIQSKLPIDNIFGCRAALIRTSLAYSDKGKRLKALVPIREYMHSIQPPGDNLTRPLLIHFQELLQSFVEFSGTQTASGTVARLSSNYSNIQNLLLNGFQQGHPDLVNSIYCACYLNNFSQVIGQGPIPLLGQIHTILPHPCDHRLEAYFISELVNSKYYCPLPELETLVSRALKHFDCFDDPDLKCMRSHYYPCFGTYVFFFVGGFHISLAYYHSHYQHDFPAAINVCQTAISLAILTGNNKRHSQALCHLAFIKWMLGDYYAAQMLASKSQRLARTSANLYREAHALHVKTMCSYQLGDYSQSISFSRRATDLLGLCGMLGSDLDHGIKSTQAEVHNLKSEYLEACNIYTQMLQEATIEQDPSTHAMALLNLADIDLSMGATKDDVQRNLNAARSLFTSMGQVTQVTMCDTILANLYLRDGKMLAAKTLFVKCMNISMGNQAEIMAYCLERLGDVSRWTGLGSNSSWTTVFLMHSLKFKEKLGTYKALKFLGDICLAQDDGETAISLFTVALDGFTYMNIHRNRAECMLQLGDIFKKHGEALKAIELWETAKPLFERSSQSQQVEQINKRRAGMSQDVHDQHRHNLARLAELDAPCGSVEKQEDDSADIENMVKDGGKEMNPCS
jgi:tetratricopeptide (TPR) repeat protein